MIVIFYATTSAMLLINMVVFFYVSHRKIPLLEQMLDRCPLIQEHLHSLKSAGLVGRVIRQAMIVHAISDREKLHEQGLVDKCQIEALPRNLKLWITIPDRIGYGIMAALILTYFI
jgi:hypothetical protein